VIVIFQNSLLVTMAMIVNIIVGYALILLVINMKECVHMDVLKGFKGLQCQSSGLLNII